jgi:hypothetical protein
MKDENFNANKSDKVILLHFILCDWGLVLCGIAWHDFVTSSLLMRKRYFDGSFVRKIEI